MKEIPSHGGSIRVYAAPRGTMTVDETVPVQLEAERRAGIPDGTAFAEFRRRVMLSKLRLHALLAGLRAEGQRVYGIGAPSRASTLINYVGLDDGILECVMEIAGSPKVGRYIPGTRIPVLEETRLFEEQPEYALLLSWHIADELQGNLRKKGYRGRFIVPLPEPRILD